MRISDVCKDYFSRFQSVNITPINVRELEEKARTFVEGREYSTEIFNYIKSVLDDHSFQENPQLFMDNWKEKRGLTKEFRFAEDSARMFFEQELVLS